MWCLVGLVTGTVAFSLALAWWAAAAGGLTYWFWERWIPYDPDENTTLAELLGFGEGRHPEIVLNLVIGAVALLTLPLVVRFAAALHGSLAHVMLSSRAELQQEVRRVEGGRDAAREAEAASLRRLERDIHDGPQQRLVRLTMDLGRARRQLADDPDRASETIDAALLQARETVDELRSLSRGIAPPLLVDRGLTAALGELTVRSEVPVEATIDVPGHAAAARRDRGLLRGRRGAHQRREAQRGHPRLGRRLDGERRGRGPDRGRRRRRCAPRQGQRPGRPAPAGAGRRRPARGELARGWADRGLAHPVAAHGHPGRMRIVVADDSLLLREGLQLLLAEAGHEVVAAVGDGPSYVAATLEHRPDVGVVDVRMPPSHTDEGLRAAVEVRRAWPDARIMVLSQYVEVSYADDLLASGDGGVGYLLKDRVSDLDDFLAALATVAEGGTVLDPQVVAQLMSRRRDPLEGLTPREREVLALMAEGRSNAAIAEALVVTEGAVEKHTQRIFAKLGLLPDDAQHRRVLAVVRYPAGRVTRGSVTERVRGPPAVEASPLAAVAVPMVSEWTRVSTDARLDVRCRRRR